MTLDEFVERLNDYEYRLDHIEYMSDANLRYIKTSVSELQWRAKQFDLPITKLHLGLSQLKLSME